MAPVCFLLLASEHVIPVLIKHKFFASTLRACDSEVKIAFIITRRRNNVVVSFGTLKVQYFMLTEVRDCDLLIVVTSFTFLKKEKTC